MLRTCQFASSQPKKLQTRHGSSVDRGIKTCAFASHKPAAPLRKSITEICGWAAAAMHEGGAFVIFVSMGSIGGCAAMHGDAPTGGVT